MKQRTRLAAFEAAMPDTVQQRLNSWTHDLARARIARDYQRFLSEWKDADPELQPRVSVIRHRLTRLIAAER